MVQPGPDGDRLAELEERLALFERSQAATGVGSFRAYLGPESPLELTEEAYRILGVEPGTPLRNVDLYRHIHPDDRERLIETIVIVRSQRIRQQLEIRVVRSDGTEVNVLATAAPASEVDPYASVIGTLTDITGRRRFYLEPKLPDRLEAERELRHAMRNNELFLEYQPIASLVSGEYVGVEALVRWNHPSRGRVEPSEFVPLAEESGLIYELGSWVLAQACNVLRSWFDAGLPRDFVMGVNLSAVQLRAEGLPMMVKEALAQSGVQGPNLLLEVTESVCVEGTLDEQSLREIRNLGVHVAIDDFGTKYSALGYLPRLPVDALKIDAEFIRAIHDPAGRAVVVAIAALGKALGHTVTAEGVETDAQLSAVYHAGCDAVQGFYISPPRNADECLRVVLSSGPLVI